MKKGRIFGNEMFSGEGLTLHLEKHGFKRLKNETGWEFRKRIFPDFFQKNVDLALEFLLGANVAKWNEMDKMLHRSLTEKSNPSKKELVTFAKSFSCDPAEFRKQLTASCEENATV